MENCIHSQFEVQKILGITFLIFVKICQMKFLIILAIVYIAYRFIFRSNQLESGAKPQIEDQELDDEFVEYEELD